jgi:hypothetical protein
MPPQQAVTMDGTLRFLKIVHGAILCSMVLYVVTAELLVPHASQDLNRTFVNGIALASASMIGIALIVRAKIILPAVEALQTKPEDSALLKRWRNGSFVFYVFAETATLIGVALRFLGGSRSLAMPFYAAGIGLILFGWPKRP